MNDVSLNLRERILVVVMWFVQMYGYGGLNYWDFVNEVGIKVVSIYYYFESKVDFGVVVVRCYWEDLVVVLDDMLV